MTKKWEKKMVEGKKERAKIKINAVESKEATMSKEEKHHTVMRKTSTKKRLSPLPSFWQSALFAESTVDCFWTQPFFLRSIFN